mmetsp:Transcript_30250/g.90721  ORF Transcript_30250/g.90721 Transcript_30250/m.90721 type:complete len:495 (-) Transcript_30250:124-1608(-)
MRWGLPRRRKSSRISSTEVDCEEVSTHVVSPFSLRPRGSRGSPASVVSPESDDGIAVMPMSVREGGRATQGINGGVGRRVSWSDQQQYHRFPRSAPPVSDSTAEPWDFHDDGTGDPEPLAGRAVAGRRRCTTLMHLSAGAPKAASQGQGRQSRGRSATAEASEAVVDRDTLGELFSPPPPGRRRRRISSRGSVGSAASGGVSSRGSTDSVGNLWGPTGMNSDGRGWTPPDASSTGLPPMVPLVSPSVSTTCDPFSPPALSATPSTDRPLRWTPMTAGDGADAAGQIPEQEEIVALEKRRDLPSHCPSTSVSSMGWSPERAASNESDYAEIDDAAASGSGGAAAAVAGSASAPALARVSEPHCESPRLPPRRQRSPTKRMQVPPYITIDTVSASTGDVSTAAKVSDVPLSQLPRREVVSVLVRCAPCAGTFVFREFSGKVCLSLWDGYGVQHFTVMDKARVLPASEFTPAHWRTFFRRYKIRGALPVALRCAVVW